MLKAGSRALAAGSETRKGGVSRPGPPQALPGIWSPVKLSP